jgi:hypothetical protein
MAKPKTPTRKALARYFHDTDTLIRFEQLFKSVGEDIPTFIGVIQLAADTTGAQVNSALAQIFELQNQSIELEFLMAATCIS